MKNKNQKQGLTGSAEFVRQLHADGVSKAEALKQVCATYPKIEKNHTHFELRWAVAEGIAKSAKTKSAKAAEKPAQAGKPPKRKLPAPPPARLSSPPPRPTKGVQS